MLSVAFFKTLIFNVFLLLATLKCVDFLHDEFGRIQVTSGICHPVPLLSGYSLNGSLLLL